MSLRWDAQGGSIIRSSGWSPQAGQGGLLQPGWSAGWAAGGRKAPGAVTTD